MSWSGYKRILVMEAGWGSPVFNQVRGHCSFMTSQSCHLPVPGQPNLALCLRLGVYFDVGKQNRHRKNARRSRPISLYLFMMFSLHFSGLTYHNKVCWPQSIDSYGRGDMWLATLSLCVHDVHIHHGLQLISNVFLKNGNTQPLYRGTMLATILMVKR